MGGKEIEGSSFGVTFSDPHLLQRDFLSRLDDKGNRDRARGAYCAVSIREEVSGLRVPDRRL